MVNEFFKKIASFSLIGIAGAFVDYGTRSALISLGLSAWISRALSYLFGSSTTYYANSKFTFSGKRSKGEISKASAVYALCFTLAVLVDALSRSFYQGSLSLEISWFLSQASATLVNFLLQNFWVFKGNEELKDISAGSSD